jgi:hypothetical protein
VTAEALSAVIAMLDAHSGADALWVFGSEASGNAGPESDLDLAVLFRQPPSTLERLDLQARLAALAGRPVDLIDLDHAPPPLAFQVLRNGKLRVDRNPSRRHAFASALTGRYQDVSFLRAPIIRHLTMRLQHGRT